MRGETMREVHAKLGEDIWLGRRGENLATRVIFDVSGWMSSGKGTISLLHQRNGDNVPYICVITVDGGTVMWDITAADVEVAGRGRAELQYLDGDVCKKSAIYTTNTLRALTNAGDAPPAPHEGWVREVLEAKAAADASAQNAQGSAETAESYALEAEIYSGTARGAASQAQSAADRAQSAAQTAAMDAANAAAPLAAQQALAEAENRLVGYQANAANSAQSALQSEQNAAQSAQAATSSEEEAGRMAQAADVAKNAAETAETNAKNAKSAAETAKNAAETARTAAEAARTGAETAAGEAKTSAENAYDSALTAGACLLNTESYMQKAQSAAAQAQSSADRAESAAERAESAGIQSDWNQNDSAADDYVKNRPFYRTSTPVYEEYQLLPERTITFDGQVAAFTYPVDVPTGRCTVFWGGSQYECDPVVADGGFYLIQPDVFTIEYSAGGTFKVTAINRYDRLILKITSLRVAGYEVVKLPNEYLDTDYIKEVAGEHGGGDSVQSDYNQNDPANPDYIKNRPFYSENGGAVAVFPETTFQIEDELYMESDPTQTVEKLTAGETYTINWNGTVHEVVCREQYLDQFEVEDLWKSFEVDGDGQLIAFGYYDSKRNDPGVIIECRGFGGGEFTVSISAGLGEEVVHKLDNKYLDEDYIKEISKDDDHIKDVVNEVYIKSIIDEDYINEVVGDHDGGDSVQSDYNQNDPTKPDYIKNRPFYAEGGGELLPETGFYMEDGVYFDENPSKTMLVAGEAYTVTVNGEEHSVVCVDVMEDWFEEGAELWQVLEVDDPDNEVHVRIGFLCRSTTDEYFIFIEETNGGNGTIYIGVSGGAEVIHKLDNKFLNLTAEEWTFELEDGSTVKKRVMLE